MKKSLHNIKIKLNFKFLGLVEEKGEGRMDFDIGTDIIEVDRISRLIDDDKFLRKVFTDNEINYCKNKKNSKEHYAVRFAAKEAVIKALDNKEIPLKDIEILNTKNGKPEIIFNNKWSIYRNRVKISLSHCHSFAVAQALYINR